MAFFGADNHDFDFIDGLADGKTRPGMPITAEELAARHVAIADETGEGVSIEDLETFLDIKIVPVDGMMADLLLEPPVDLGLED